MFLLLLTVGSYYELVAFQQWVMSLSKFWLIHCLFHLDCYIFFLPRQPSLSMGFVGMNVDEVFAISVFRKVVVS